MRTRKTKAPLIVNQPVVFGKSIGFGRNGEVFEARIRNQGKKGTKQWDAAVKLLNPPDGCSMVSESVQRTNSINQQKVWRAFKQAGLPVVGYHKLDLRQTLPTSRGRVPNTKYLAVYMPNLALKRTLEPVNNFFGRPTFLLKLNVARDRSLIKGLASDLATIHGLGFTYKNFVDFWHFYPRGETYGRVIMDFEEFAKSAGEENCVKNVLNIMDYLKPPEGKYFVQRYFAACKNNLLRRALRQKLVQADHADYIPRGIV